MCKKVQQPFLSLVMLTSNDEKIIEGGIRRLAKLPYLKPDGSLNYELIVIDEESRDQTFDILERMSMMYPLLKVSKKKEEEGLWEKVSTMVEGEKICLLDRYSFLESNLLKVIKNHLNDEKVLDLRKNKKRKLLERKGVPC